MLVRFSQKPPHIVLLHVDSISEGRDFGRPIVRCDDGDVCGICCEHAVGCIGNVAVCGGFRCDDDICGPVGSDDNGDDSVCDGALDIVATVIVKLLKIIVYVVQLINVSDSISRQSCN